MESLPAEILEQIVLQCEHSSQKTLRSVNHRLHDLSTPNVFERLYIAPCVFDEALDNFAKLARSQRRLSNHVRSITLLADILPAWSRSTFELIAREGGDVDEHTLTAAWDKFRQLLQKQLDWSEWNAHHQHVFNDLLSYFPNLTQASVDTAVQVQGSTALLPIWTRLRPQLLISPSDWMNIVGDCYPAEERMLRSSHAVLNLLEAIGFRSSFVGITQVSKLTFRAKTNGRFKALLVSHAPDDATYTFSQQIETRFQTCLGAFTHLTDLDLQIPEPVTDHARDLSDEERNTVLKFNGLEVTEMLHRAKGLQRLRLEYCSESVHSISCKPRGDDEHPLSPLFQMGNNPWPSLRHVDLTVDVPQTLLLNFLRKVSANLRSLTLKDMYVYDGQVLLAELPKVVKLDRVYMERVWTKVGSRDANADEPWHVLINDSGLDTDEPYKRGVKAYLLGQSDDLPRTAEVHS